MCEYDNAGVLGHEHGWITRHCHSCTGFFLYNLNNGLSHLHCVNISVCTYNICGRIIAKITMMKIKPGGKNACTYILIVRKLYSGNESTSNLLSMQCRLYHSAKNSCHDFSSTPQVNII